MKKKYDANLMGYINFFENLTKVKVKDAYIKEDLIVFIIQQGGLRRALGKNGINIKRMANLTKKRLRVIEFNDNVEKFIENFIYPNKADNIEKEENIVKIKASGAKTKGLLIGRGSKNLNELKAIVARYFKIDDIKVE